MATTTPNYGWAVPTSTDLVKDGATAIETLGDSIDASMFTALGTKKAGMVLLNTTSFSGVASQSVNDVFSATYDSYMVVVQNLTSVNNNNALKFRMRVAGADNSSNNYERAQLYVGGFTAQAFGSENSVLDSYADGGYLNNTIQQHSVFYVFNPFLSANTTINTISIGSWLTYAGAVLTVTTSYTGFTLTTNGGNFAGTITVYGLAK
jgi:hypothetical protein